mmetsp:Transcript_11060/g.29454  ORF Transcript_11060/g.29454 Transcript_11060/m.29454 type:complete len:205 (-) Transcript_11060:30-644(-)
MLSRVSGRTSSTETPAPMRNSARRAEYRRHNSESSMRSARKTSALGKCLWSNFVPIFRTYSPPISSWKLSGHRAADFQYQGGQRPSLSRMSHSIAWPKNPFSFFRWAQLRQHVLKCLPSGPIAQRRPQPSTQGASPEVALETDLVDFADGADSEDRAGAADSKLRANASASCASSSASVVGSHAIEADGQSRDEGRHCQAGRPP